MKNNEIIEIDGKKFRVELHEVKSPTYEEALDVLKPQYFPFLNGGIIKEYYIDNIKGNVPTKKDALSLIAYQKLKVLEAYYNEGTKGEYGLFLTHAGIHLSESKDVFNLKDRGTALRFIEEQKELLKQFYQI